MRTILVSNSSSAALVLLLAAAVAACGEPTEVALDHAPALVLFLGDGMGNGAVDATRSSVGSLAMESLMVRRQVSTASASSDTTDSGAAATAYSTGTSTRNGAIGVDAHGIPRETVLEEAEALGWRTGLVATSSVTHATPAAFAAHVASRNEQDNIAVQMALSGVDVLLGGGYDRFSPESRPDGLDLLGVFRDRGCAVWKTVADLQAPPPECVIGLLAGDMLPPADSRQVTLAQLTEVALDVLSADGGAFFLMVEGSQIDWAAHANDGPGLVSEMLDFDAAVRTALDYLDGRPNVTLVVTADHETGGLTATWDESGDSLIFEWTTGSHTDALVPLFARGAVAEMLPSPVGNDSVGRMFFRLLRR